MVATGPANHRSEHEQFLRTRYFASLDGLRCLSILWVIGFHAQLSNPILHRLFRRGDWGVGLFFAISGFLITTLLLRERSASGEISLRKFYARRTLRIFPLYYAAIGIYALLVWRFEHGPERSVFFHHLPFFATYTGNWFVDRFAADRVIFAFSWTLATEEQFYLLWPSIIRFSRRELTPLIVIVIALIFTTATNAMDAAGRLPFNADVNRILTSIAPAICLGCVLAFALHRRSSFERLRGLLGRRASAPLAMLLVLALYAVLVHVAADSRFELSLDAAMVPAVVLLVGACCFREMHPLRWLLANPVVRYVGTTSYGIYLLHMLALNFAKKLTSTRGAGFLGVAILLSVALASMSFWLYERQFLKLKSRFTTRVPNEPSKPELQPSVSAASSFLSSPAPKVA